MRARVLAEALRRDLTHTETTPRADDVHLRSAIEWLFRSQDVAESDGCSATYNLVLGWERAYPETTGYIVPTLYDYATHADDSEARHRAERMARWLLDVQLDSGAFPGGTVGGTPEPSVFNTGQILFGLARAHAETGDNAFATALRDASGWLADVQEPEGYWSSHTYESMVHAYTARVGWALLVAYDVTGEDRVRDAAVRNLEWVQRIQQENDTFRHWAFTPDDDAFLHTIAYTIRGLVEGGHYLGNRAIVEAGQRAADRLIADQRRNGALAGAYDDGWNGVDFSCLTGVAQTAIIWIRLAELTGEADYADAARQAIQELKLAQPLDGAAPIRGGLAGSKPVWGPYMRLRYPNWAPKFLVDAILTANRHDCDTDQSRAVITKRKSQR
ncbi:prenyltransferase/squalene oxidase repeat-containing protein [Halobellus rarus]|uniref:Prenyltransferase/squalene oxidase repeat-containing protein n=1 Tax=Halobellus rarus TaxID=1126237 RepID=A0ABD6CQP9_9EURY|nr:prenyltransferase/squalene oxidase repeat-containing protein [Halobellus rarus]